MVIIKQEGISIPSTLHSTLPNTKNIIHLEWGHQLHTTHLQVNMMFRPNTQNLLHLEWGHQLHTTHLQVNMMFRLLPEGLDCLVMALEEISSVEFGWACDLKNHKYYFCCVP
jgi:hypothetical protein